MLKDRKERIRGQIRRSLIRVVILTDFNRPVARKVAIRLYANAGDWHHVQQVECHCRPNGDIDLALLASVLNVDGCSVSQDHRDNKLGLSLHVDYRS
jgi:uncharacterized Zn finger protein